MTEINLKRQLVPFEWLQLSPEVKNLFIKWFQISRSGGSQVVGDKVISDGHTVDDLSKVSLASLQAFLHTDETHWDNLLQLTINKMENYVESIADPDTKDPGAKQGTTGETSRTEEAKKGNKRKAISVPRS